MVYHDSLSHIYNLCFALNIHKVVPAQWASTLVTALEPSEQTDRVESVLAGRAAFVRRLHVSGDHRVTNGTLAVSLQSALDVAPECQQSIDKVAIGEHDHTLDRK